MPIDGIARLGAVALSFAMAIGCSHAPRGLAVTDIDAGPSVGSSLPSADPLAALLRFENATRAKTDFVHKSPSSIALGADPYVIRRDGRASGVKDRFLGLLRGRSALVQLDASLHEYARLPAPESPTGLAIASNGEVFAVGELSSRVARYRTVPHRVPRSAGAPPVSEARLELAGSIELPGVLAMRDVATGPEGLIYVVEEHEGRLLTLEPRTQSGAAPPARRVESTVCHGPIHVMRVGRTVLVDCLLDHVIVIRAVDGRGYPVTEGERRIVHDGPMWGLDALEAGRGLVVAVGGVEDHPLDRTEGSFGFVDSFVTLYLVAADEVVKLSEVNTSALGVVTPKALKLWRNAPRSLGLAVAAYGSDRMAMLDWSDPNALERKEALGEPTVTTRVVPPGSAMMDLLPDGSLVLANPLLDAWVHESANGIAVIHIEDDLSTARSGDSKLGEALFFTTLMAPWDKSDGRLSRFTCETCHWEGYVDGRTHHTGRADVRATTKPLLGLFNNRPHFSRALDPDMTTMVDNEFRVAGAKSDHSPWFSLSLRDWPWVRELADVEPILSPEALRRALMTFLMDFAHRPNPSVIGRAGWTDIERRGADVFRDKCEACHESRLVADAPWTRVPFADWEDLVMAPEGPIVWARAEYEKTGIMPYVSEKGARVVSLRRLYKKYPYFTNGSAKSIRSVLDRAKFANGFFFHDGAPEWANELTEQEKSDLAAFLDLL